MLGRNLWTSTRPSSLKVTARKIIGDYMFVEELTIGGIGLTNLQWSSRTPTHQAADLDARSGSFSSLA